jgi:hypothetical protein
MEVAKRRLAREGGQRDEQSEQSKSAHGGGL